MSTDYYSVTILNRRNSTKLNDLNQSELFHLSTIIGVRFSELSNMYTLDSMFVT